MILGIWSGSLLDASQGRFLSGMPNREETPGLTEATLERSYLLASMGTSLSHPGGAGGSGQREECLNLPS